jgi:flagellar hook-basal body complex protein FliE
MFEKSFSEALVQMLKESPEQQEKLRRAAEKLVAGEDDAKKKLGNRLLAILDRFAGKS